MEKKLIGIVAVVAVALFQICGSKSASGSADSNKNAVALFKVSAPPPCIGCTTLNGADSAIATQNINNFANLKDKDNTQSKEASIWFNRQQIDSINNLLTMESAASIPPEKRVDGVRFYFGTNTTPNSSPKLSLSIYMVTTRQRSGSDPQVCGTSPIVCSQHIDYYNHSGYFKSGSFGDNTNTINTSKPKHDTNDLYEVPIPGGPCLGAPADYVDNNTAHTWVKDFRYKDTTPINTKSEWFSLCFIQYMFNTIHNNSNKLGGLRVYLALGINQNYPDTYRDIFLLVPSDNQGGDYYGCIDQLASLRSNCLPAADSLLFKQKFPIILRNKVGEKIKIDKPTFEQMAKYKFLYDGGGSGGAYDNGELCPYNCN